MVVRITLTIKHIRGHTFTVESNRDADVLGLKVQIWDTQKIPIEHQRLVYGGRELQDGVKLVDVGIDDNSMVFLVESSNAAALPQSEASEIAPPVAYSSEGVNMMPVISAISMANNESKFVSINLPDPDVRYEALNEETLSEERIVSVLDLAYWIRLYFILGIFLSGLCVFNCFWSLIPLIIYILGWCGTRKLRRCCLTLPLLLTMLIGFGGLVATVYCMIMHFHAWVFLPMFIAFLHVIIFFSICKLMCRISKLSEEEWCNARTRIASRGCCC